MSKVEKSADLPEESRREIFKALVETQDREVPVGKSRTDVARKFGISEALVREIESEGLANQWPPL